MVGVERECENISTFSRVSVLSRREYHYLSLSLSSSREYVLFVSPLSLHNSQWGVINIVINARVVVTGQSWQVK